MRKTWTVSETTPGWMAHVVTFVVFVLGGGILAYAIVNDYLPAIEAKRAQLRQTPATLNSIEVTERRVDGRDVFNVAVDFSYTIDGVGYDSTRLGFGKTKWPGSRRWAEGVVAEAKQREPFFVYADARSPSRAVLLDETSGVISPATYLITIVGGAFFLLGGWSTLASAFGAIRGTRG